MDEPDYRANALSIRYVEEHPGLGEVADPGLRDVALAAAVLLADQDRPRVVVSGGGRRSRDGGHGLSAWMRAGREW